jgi:hypothetical protein
MLLVTDILSPFNEGGRSGMARWAAQLLGALGSAREANESDVTTLHIQFERLKHCQMLLI